MNVTSQAIVSMAVRGESSIARPSNKMLAIMGVGLLSIVAPTLWAVATTVWRTEQGAHGPIVVVMAVWLFMRRWPTMRHNGVPGSQPLGFTLLALACLAYIVTTIIGSLVLRGLSVYGALLVALYLFVGWRVMWREWFVLLYVLAILPPPGSVVALMTQPLRLEISRIAVTLLYKLGLPVAQEGLTVYVGAYIIEVKAACGGMNSIISLSSIAMFYGYIRHNMTVRLGLIYLILSITVAIASNFFRVLILILITYYFGNGVAQGFIHQGAGLFTFTVGLLMLSGIDWAISPLLDRGKARSVAGRE